MPTPQFLQDLAAAAGKKSAPTGQNAVLAQYLSEAWALQNRASDSGAIAFQTHTGHGRAMTDNRDARSAWLKVKGAAKSIGGHDGTVQDAQDRVEELDVAYEALVADKKAYGKRNIHLRLPSTANASNYGGGAPSGGGTKWALLVAAGAAAAKLAGLW